jgi:hypothetical protein
MSLTKISRKRKENQFSLVCITLAWASARCNTLFLVIFFRLSVNSQELAKVFVFFLFIYLHVTEVRV